MEVKISKGRGKTSTEFFDHAIIRIGSDISNHVALDQKQAEPFHLQILNNSDPDQKNYIVNLTEQPVAVTLSQEAFWLNPYATSELNNGDLIEIGTYNIVINLPVTDNTLIASKYFDAELSFPTEFLMPDTILEGGLTIRNTGEQRGCKFKVEVEGLPADCLEIDPVPLLYPGAEELIPFRLLHQSIAPEVGYTSFLTTITSPESYPEQKVVLQHKVYVAPSYRQQIWVTEVAETGDEDIQPVDKTIQRTWKTITFDSVTADQRTKTVKGIEQEAVKEVTPKQTADVDPVLDEKVVEQEDAVPPIDESIVDLIDSTDNESDVEQSDIDQQEIIDEDVVAEEVAAAPPVDQKPTVKVIGNKFKDFWEEDETAAD